MSGMTRSQLHYWFGDPGDDGTSRASLASRAERAEREAMAQRELEDERHSVLATPGDAHREWHLNAGVPMGQPGCPQDACHPIEEGPLDWGFPETVDAVWPGAVKCGNKQGPYAEGHYHLGVAAVRECYAAAGRFTKAGSARQTGEQRPEPVNDPPPTSVAVSSSPPLPSARWETIPVGGQGYGYYALSEEQTGDKIRFFRVERPAKGKWAGKTFIKEQGGSEFYPVEPKGRGYAYLTLIAEDPQAAGMLYAEKLDKCTRCNRTLTDPESRAAGMGPDCRAKGGW